MADTARSYQCARVSFPTGNFILRWEVADDLPSMTGPGLAEWMALIAFLQGKLETSERVSVYGRRNG
jgi:hypothetical protein